MEALDTKDFARDFFNVDGEDLLNFTLDVEVDESNKENINFFKPSSSSVISSVTSTVSNGGSSPLPADEEEDLEWLSNKDAFPAVEFDIINNSTEMGILGQHSPVSVLENVVINEKRIHNQGIIQLLPCGFPYFARKKRISRKRRTGFGHNKHLLLVGHEITVVNVRNYSQEPPLTPPPKMVKRYNRSCLHCGSDTTPQWRAGPKGPKTLCNACGVRYNSGRLVPEYRPACSPTFSAGMHSNSHRKIVEMRKLKQVGGMVVVKGTF